MSAHGATLESSHADSAPLPQPPDWQNRFLEIAGEPVWLQSQEELEELAGTLADDQIRSALDKLSAEPSGASAILGGLLVRRWSAQSPAAAAQWVANLPDNDFGHAVFKEVVVPWVEQDLTGAVAWVQQLPAGGNKTAAELSLAAEAATRKETATAIVLVAGLPSGPERDGILNYSVRQWATVNQDKAVSWINRVQEPVLREQMLEDVAVDMGIQNPSRAAAFAATALPPGRAQDNAVVGIVRFWATSAPDQAAAWVAQFPHGDIRVTAIKNLVDVWGQDDPGAAGAWVNAISQAE